MIINGKLSPTYYDSNGLQIYEPNVVGAQPKSVGPDEPDELEEIETKKARLVRQTSEVNMPGAIDESEIDSRSADHGTGNNSSYLYIFAEK